MKVNIIGFDNKHSLDFYSLNIEWLQKYFEVEPFDDEVLSKPENYIINKGGYIFFAKINNTIVGTYALMPLPKQEAFELTKMAVSPDYRGQKIGQKLLQHCINFAKASHFNRLLLYSSQKLENAIYLYKKFGFMEIKVEDNCPYKRCDIKMEYFLNKTL